MKKLMSAAIIAAMIGTMVGSMTASAYEVVSGEPTKVAIEAVEEALAAAAEADLPDASGDAAKTIIFSGSSFQAMSEAEELWKFMVESLTGGTLTIDWHPWNELGGDLDVTTNTQFGDIGMGITSPAPITSMIPNLALFDSLYVITDQQLAYDVMDGEIGQQINQDFENAGLKILMWCENGFRELTCKKEVTGLDSLKGMKIRTMENKLQMAGWSALGTNPTPMAFGEVFTALQQGAVDGQENPLGLIEANSFMDVCDYLVMTNHNYTPMLIFMNLDLYNSLSDAQKTIIDFVDEYVTQWERDYNVANNKVILENFKSNGTNVIEPDEELLGTFKQAILDAGVYDQIKETMANPELFDKLLEMAG